MNDKITSEDFELEKQNNKNMVNENNKTKQFKLLTQPPYITPRRICHFGIGCYIIIQITSRERK